MSGDTTILFLTAWKAVLQMSGDTTILFLTAWKAVLQNPSRDVAFNVPTALYVRN